METFYDWITLAIFGGLIVLFLDRSMEDDPPDHLWQYLVAAGGCAVANYLGNEGYTIPAVAVIATVVTYIIAVLKPFEKFKRPRK